MVTILALPFEIQAEILGKIDKSDKKSVRLTCSQLNALVEPDVFSELTLDVRPPFTTKSTRDILENLSSGKSRIASYVKKLTFSRICPSMEGYFGLRAAKVKIESLTRLSRAISVLTSLRAFNWTYWAGDPEWIINCVLDAVASRNIREFSINLKIYYRDYDNDPRLSFPLHKLRDLESLSISVTQPFFPHISDSLRQLLAQSPKLETLCLNINTRPPTETLSSPDEVVSSLLQCILSFPLKKLILEDYVASSNLSKSNIHHFRALRTIHLAIHLDMYRGPIQSLSELWSLLQAEGIFVHDIRTVHVTDTLLSYLSSYSGVEKMVLIPYYSSLEDYIPTFLKSVLPRQAESLRELSFTFQNDNYTRWCFDESMAPHLLQCTKLQCLTIYLGNRNTYGQMTAMLNAASSMLQLTDLKVNDFYANNRVYTTFLPPSEMALLEFEVTPGKFNSELIVHLPRKRAYGIRYHGFPELRFRLIHQPRAKSKLPESTEKTTIKDLTRKPLRLVKGLGKRLWV